MRRVVISGLGVVAPNGIGKDVFWTAGTDCELIVRGTVPSYHVKQLALQGGLEVLRSDPELAVGLEFDVVVSPRSFTPYYWTDENNDR